jgi:hypothetical protein
LFVTSSVYVSVRFFEPGSRESDFRIARSARRGSRTSSSTFWSSALPVPPGIPLWGSFAANVRPIEAS